MRRLLIPLLVILIGAATLWQRQTETGLLATIRGEVPVPAGLQTPASLPARGGLPAEAWETLELIERGGPFPYRKDGSEFQNRQDHLPAAARGYYREYTVPTPGAPDRGARRIIAGGRPPAVWYYTDDHYRSFRSITPEDGSSP